MAGSRYLARFLLAAGLLAGSSAVSAEGKVWALVVGVDDYVKDSVSDLRYAVADAKLFARALQDTMKLPAEQIFLLTSDSVDEQTQPKVLNVAYRLGALAEKLKPDDTVVFFFAGHGLTIDGQPFLLTEEADNRNALTLKASALHGGDLISNLRALKAGSVWVVLDACRNTPGSKGENRLDGAIMGSFSHADVGLQQTATMFSCRVGERSWEWEEKRHGCYTYYLVEGLRRQAADAAGRVTMQRIAEYVGTTVPAATQKLGTPQNPTLFYGGPGGEKWLLATVQPPSSGGAGAAKKDLDTSRYVAQLEALQAKLDRETALRVAAEERARLEQSRRVELDQRIALLEKKVTGTPGLKSSIGEPVAYNDRGLSQTDQVRQLQSELQRLQKENDELKQRLAQLEIEGTKVGLAPREVTLESPEWQAAEREERLLAQESPQAPLEDRLQRAHKLRGTYARKLDVLERAYAQPLARRGTPNGVAREVAFLQSMLDSQKQVSVAHEKRLTAAESSLQEAQLRLAEAQARSEMFEALYRNEQQKAESYRRQHSEAMAQLRAVTTRLDYAVRDSRVADEQRRQLQAQVDEIEKGQGLGRNPWARTRPGRIEDIFQVIPLPPQPTELPP
jgi:hypothetical protein